ncbi:MAG: hypothetical protein HYT61_02045 [Candidatus Yanofskybacteria bacterium]|nr:hypothetical protein [Candidatus Yanofskybacteria bacterium]
MATDIQKNALCYGQKFGHDFDVIGGKCSKCGIQQGELNGGLQKIEYFIKKPEHGLHSERHALAKEISDFCGEPKKFGMYLGIIKNIGLPRAYKIFAELKQAKKIETPGKLFLYLSAYKPRTFSGQDATHQESNNPEKVRGKKPVKEKNNNLPQNGNRKRTQKNTSQKIKKRRKDNA